MKDKIHCILIIFIAAHSYSFAQDTIQKANENIVYYPNGKISSITHGEGVFWNGECVWYDTLGNILIKETYLNGNKVGHAQYYENGQIRIDGNYIKYGIKEGEWTYYKNDKEIDRILLYRNDSVIKHFEIDANNKRFEIIHYKSIEDAKNNPESVYYLDLSSKGLKTFPQDILLFKNLRYLDLSAYDINDTDSAKKYFDSTFTYQRSLPRHSSYDPYIPIAGAYNQNTIKSIPDEIAILKSLKSINVFDTNLSKKQVLKLKKLLPKNCIILSEWTLDD